jgi:hypothetical protein
MNAGRVDDLMGTSMEGRGTSESRLYSLLVDRALLGTGISDANNVEGSALLRAWKFDMFILERRTRQVE